MRSPAVSSAPTRSRRRATTGPESTRSVTSITVTPVTSSPASIAAATGDGPRYFGSSDGWTFRQPSRGALQHVVGEIQPVRGYDYDVRPEIGQAAPRDNVPAQRLRLQDVQSPFERVGLHRRRSGPPAPAERPVRLRVDGDRIVPGVDQRRQHRYGEGGRAHEHDSHAASLDNPGVRIAGMEIRPATPQFPTSVIPSNGDLCTTVVPAQAGTQGWGSQIRSRRISTNVVSCKGVSQRSPNAGIYPRHGALSPRKQSVARAFPIRS